MTARRVLLMSPREPSGMTWLANCLLELGVCTWRHSRKSMWRDETGGVSRLQPQEDTLKRWLPVLSTQTEFRFRPGLDVQWDHTWPRDDDVGREVLLFVRDPRDALYSRYRREAGAVGYREYASMRDPWTLLDRVDTWCLFERVWLAHPRVHVLRFEDYKSDARALLTRTLSILRVDATDDAIERALEGSSFERARDAEVAYLKAHPEQNLQQINRAGGVGSWRQLEGDDATVAADLERRGADLMTRFGYATDADAAVPDLSGHIAAVPGLSRLPLRPPATGVGDGGVREALAAWARDLDDRTLDRLELTANDRAILVHSLRGWLTHQHATQDARLSGLLSGPPADPSWFQLQLLRRTRRLADLRGVTPLLAGRVLLERVKRLRR
ncbi:MAG: sulfotransferase domain-containing protein [Myxococcales bacterium]|nr:sulfotransferase domain-containing protein [Myxococcales bacterium]